MGGSYPLVIVLVNESLVDMLLLLWMGSVIIVSAALPDNFTITDEVLLELSRELWKAGGPINRPITLDFQGHIPEFKNFTDLAPRRLVQSVDPSIHNIPSIKLFKKLLDNYNPKVWLPELITQSEWKEVDAFLSAIMSTPVMRKARAFLNETDLVPYSEFKSTLKDVWFSLYERSKTLSSSAFEHVFLGEKSGKKSKGIHNWLRYVEEEKQGRINYKGYFEKQKVGEVYLVTLRLDWNRASKDLTSISFGTYPEYELAIYTVCWFARRNERCPVDLGGATAYVQTYTMNYRSQPYIATAYFEFDFNMTSGFR